jgi:hypothetical protein
VCAHVKERRRNTKKQAREHSESLFASLLIQRTLLKKISEILRETKKL